ncbi:MAG TPA: class I SAM-dependent methyltransferase [Kiritimatiellia bacterium]|nr:class I SAM-dependent methyltransferase [Kiritimatiellia bacterium]HMP33689.1 class I SAM-dependent methyltransferase [Kiritimatiellia bacterium]
MQREPEPELMDEAEQAMAYARADFEAPHARFIELFRTSFPGWSGEGHVLDLGCGPGDIAVRFARAYPRVSIDGIDGAEAMLAAGRCVFARDPHFLANVRLHKVLLPQEQPPRRDYDATISNSLLHHLHDPMVLWNAVAACTRPGAPVFVIDLMRPDSREQAAALQRLHVGSEPAVLQRDFFNSLLAAFTVEEIAAQLGAAGLGHLSVGAISDRHVMVKGWR